MRGVTLRAAIVLMRLRERTPEVSNASIDGLSEVFNHPVFTDGTPDVRIKIMHESAQSRYDDEVAFPWDHYFGQPVNRWVTGNVLDLGCFTGGRAAAWFERYQPRSIAGVDVRDVFIDAASRFCASHSISAEFRVGTAEAIPWPDESFDT